MKRLTCLLFLLPICFGFSQENERELRLEFSAGYSPSQFFIGEVLHANAGLSRSAKKPGWYTNYAYHFTRTGSFSTYSYDYHTLSIGKFREWNKGHFYSCLGLNAGMYLAYEQFSEPYHWYNVGIAAFPRGEIGWTNDRLILSFGVHFPIGFGYYDNPGMDEVYQRNYWLKGLGALSPYLKVQF